MTRPQAQYQTLLDTFKSVRFEPEELDGLAGTEGADFDRQALAYLREHVEHSATVSRGERNAGTDDAAKSLAADLDQARTAQLTELDELGGAGAGLRRELGTLEHRADELLGPGLQP